MPDWKKCSEEMPPADVSVLVCWVSRYRPAYDVAAWSREYGTRKLRWYGIDLSDGPPPTHWQPLPTPPEEEK